MAARGRRRLLALCAGLLVAAAAHSRLDTSSRIAAEESFVPYPELARLATLGFDAVVADAYWLQAVQVVGGEERGIGRHATLIARLVDVVTSLDPWVDHPYRFAALWLTEDLESVLRANALLARGIAYHPQEWRNRHYLGFNHFFYLGDEVGAADVLETAIGLPRAPAYLASLVAKLRVEQGGLEAAALYLEKLATHAEDGFARAEHLKALDEIETERRARFLDEARAEYRRRHGADIREVADLLRGAYPVLRQLPPAHPHFPGFEWQLHPETGQIVSSFYRERYEPHVHRFERERRERWRREMAERAEKA